MQKGRRHFCSTDCQPVSAPSAALSDSSHRQSRPSGRGTGPWLQTRRPAGQQRVPAPRGAGRSRTRHGTAGTGSAGVGGPCAPPSPSLILGWARLSSPRCSGRSCSSSTKARSGPAPPAGVAGLPRCSGGQDQPGAAALAQGTVPQARGLPQGHSRGCSGRQSILDGDVLTPP